MTTWPGTRPAPSWPAPSGSPTSGSTSEDRSSPDHAVQTPSCSTVQYIQYSTYSIFFINKYEYFMWGHQIHLICQNVKLNKKYSLEIYRVSGLSCPEAGGCNSAILWGFPDVFSLFGPCKVGGISFRYSWTTGMKKKFRYLILKKGQISGCAQIDIFLISNFFDYLSITFFKTIQM